MATRFVRRTSTAPSQAGFPSANSVRVDSATDVLKFGTDESGTTEKEVVDLTSTQTISGAKTFTASVLPASQLRVATVALTNAEILALRATPKTLVAAPGAGSVLEFVSAEIFAVQVGAYTETDDNLAIRYTGTTGVIVSQAIEATGFVNQAASIKTNALPKIDVIATEAQSDNQPLVLHQTGNGEFGGGNAGNSWSVRITYRVHTVTW